MCDNRLAAGCVNPANSLLQGRPFTSNMPGLARHQVMPEYITHVLRLADCNKMATEMCPADEFAVGECFRMLVSVFDTRIRQPAPYLLGAPLAKFHDSVQPGLQPRIIGIDPEAHDVNCLPVPGHGKLDSRHHNEAMVLPCSLQGVRESRGCVMIRQGENVDPRGGCMADQFCGCQGSVGGCRMCVKIVNGAHKPSFYPNTQMTASSLSPEFSLIMERFLSLSERVAENWEEDKAETTPDLLIRAAEQLHDMIAHLTEDDRKLQEDIDIDQCCDYGLHLFDEQSDLALRCGLDAIAEQIEDLCFPFCLWAVRHHATISHLQPVVNALGRKANELREPGALSSLFTQVNEIMDAIDEKIRQDIDSNDPMRPWRILLINRAIIATRSFQAVLIDTAYLDIVNYLPHEAPGFFENAMEQMDLVGYPNHVKQIVETWFQRYAAKPTLH